MVYSAPRNLGINLGILCHVFQERDEEMEEEKNRKRGGGNGVEEESRQSLLESLI